MLIKSLIVLASIAILIMASGCTSTLSTNNYSHYAPSSGNLTYYEGIEILGSNNFTFNITLVLAFGEKYAPFYYDLVRNNTKFITSNDKISKMAARNGYITEVNPAFASLYDELGRPNLKAIFSALLHEARHQYDYKKFGYTSEVSAKIIEVAFNQEVASITDEVQMDFIKNLVLKNEVK